MPRFGIENVASRMASLVPPIRNGGSPIAVLCYHGVATTSTSVEQRLTVTQRSLARHIELSISSPGSIIPLSRLDGASGPAVLFTFDDNLLSHITHALPVLAEYCVPATFFLNPGELNSPAGLSSHHVDALLDAGMAIGAHNYRHRMASSYEDLSAFRRDAEKCRVFLEELDMPLAWAYPGGHLGSFREAHDVILRDIGFEVRFSTVEGVLRPGQPERVQARYVMRQSSTDRYARAALAGGLQAVTAAKYVRSVLRRAPR